MSLNYQTNQSKQLSDIRLNRKHIAVEENVSRSTKLLILFLITAGCNTDTQEEESIPSKNEQKPISQTTNQPEKSIENEDDDIECTQQTELPEPPPSSGQLSFSVNSEINPCNVQGYVVGYKDILKVKKSANNIFFIESIPEGEHDIIITAGSIASSLTESSFNRGKRWNGIEILDGIRIDQGELKLPKLGSISGTALLNDHSDHSGIDVYIPGTEYIAKTDANGNFSLRNIPVGFHNLYFEKDGYHRGQIEELDVKSYDPTLTSNIELVLSTGAEGFLQIQGGVEEYDKLEVTLVIGATKDAVLMKISESPDFTNTSWVPVVTKTSYTFDSDGEKELFIKFSDANGLESSPFQSDILIDLKVWTSIANNNELDSQHSKVIGVGKDAYFIDTYNGNYLKYSSTTNSWENISTKAAPSNISGASIAAINGGIVIWGGKKESGDNDYVNSGSIYDIQTDSWLPMNTFNSPSKRMSAVIVWNELKLFVWGGSNGSLLNDGAVYDPSTDEWTGISMTDAPSARSWPYSEKGGVPIGPNIFIWGGTPDGGMSSLVDGYIYNLINNTWKRISSTGAPSIRQRHTLTSIGESVVIWGGDPGGHSLNSGAIYNMLDNTWTSISEASLERTKHSATWTGSKIFIFGGQSGIALGDTNSYSNGELYDPISDTWEVVSIVNEPTERANHHAILLENNVFIYGGSKYPLPYLENGKIFNPDNVPKFDDQ